MKTNYVKKLFLFVISGFVFGLLPVSKAIGADLLEPQITIQTASNKLKERLQDEDFNKDFAQINLFVEEVIGPAIDFNRISALVLGKLWKTATKEEKLRFRKEFKALLIRTYSRAFIEFTDWSVRYLPYKLNEGEKKVVVKTQILQPGRRPLSVNYRMILTKGKWKVYDINIEGVSLVTNYRTSIKNEVKKLGSLSAVIDELAKKNGLQIRSKITS